jgi:hypothetical protein
VKRITLSNLLLTLADCKEAFEWDGSLRDIYIHDTTLNDWQIFIDLIRHGRYNFSFVTGDNSSSLPDNVQGVFNQQETSLLSISINGMMANCHFFGIEEIELDIDPREVVSEENFRDLMDFISSLGQALAKQVRITTENLPNRPLFLFEPENNEVKYFSYG